VCARGKKVLIAACRAGKTCWHGSGIAVAAIRLLG